ncbi:hypothetical protein [uncultured Roseobacter sp.]|nr:hypothetical protein [uncultured Roseobacter sp.]
MEKVEWLQKTPVICRQYMRDQPATPLLEKEDQKEMPRRVMRRL